MNNRVIEFSAKIELENGEIIEVGSNPAPVDPPASEVEYDDLGWSVEMKFSSCVRNKELDEWLDDKLVNGDEHDRYVASRAPRWYCVWVPGRTYTPEITEMMKCNYWKGNQYTMTGSMQLNPFWPNAFRDWESGMPHEWDFGDPVEGYKTPILYPDRKGVHEEFFKKAKYNYENKIDKRRNPNSGFYKAPLDSEKGAESFYKKSN